jgi:hypothetical protein
MQYNSKTIIFPILILKANIAAVGIRFSLQSKSCLGSKDVVNGHIDSPYCCQL